jgi:dienelactone hydrolase
LAALGYYAVLLTGKDILNPEHTGEGNLRKAIERAQRSPNALKGKAAVIGFSLGGGGALYNATPQSDLVSMVVAYYPYTLTWANNMDAFVKRFRVPVLVLPGGRDRYHNCCVIESMQAMEAAAQKNKNAVRAGGVSRGQPRLQPGDRRQRRAYGRLPPRR